MCIKQVDKLAVAHHVWIENHDMEREAKLLKEGHKPAELTIWEKLFIQKFKNQIINFEIRRRMISYQDGYNRSWSHLPDL